MSIYGSVLPGAGQVARLLVELSRGGKQRLLAGGNNSCRSCSGGSGQASRWIKALEEGEPTIVNRLIDWRG
jgi:hypothetical protein